MQNVLPQKKLLLLALQLLISISVMSSPAPRKFEKTQKKDREIVVAIIDTGVDIHHPLIKDHLWEAPSQHISTGNGSAAPFHGWNFVSDNTDIQDHHGHGTHVAGVILQRTQGLRVKLMILKYYDPEQSPQRNLLNTIKAIRFAVEMKADIINYSGGGLQKNGQEEAVIRQAQEQGILFVAAAGNEGRNTDHLGYYPASYDLSNIIAVAAMDSRQQILKTSNYGSHSVDIVAPGKNIFSSLPDGQYGLMSGTSQATAWVTGLAASILAKSERPLSPEQAKSRLILNAIKDRLLADKVKSQARIAVLQSTEI